MTKIKVTVIGEGEIDNAAIFFDGPQERTLHQLIQISNKEWSKENISVLVPGGRLRVGVVVI